MERTSRPIIAIMVLLALLGLPLLEALAIPSPQPAAAQTTPPSILVIQTDDMRPDDLAAMPKTRALLKAGGMSFDNYIAGGTPLCCPNRSTALTGLYPHNHGVLNNGGPTGGHGAFARRGNEARTIAVALDDAGYETAYLGKYLNGYPATRGLAPPPGWDQWQTFVMDGDCETCGGGRDGFYYTYTLNLNGAPRPYGSGAQAYSTTVLTRRALSLAGAVDAGTPLFMWVSPMAPHGPSLPAPGDEGAAVPPYDRTAAFNRRGAGKAAWITGLPRMSPELVQYVEQQNRERRRSLLAVDEMVDQLVAAMPDGSYVFFVSDNGYMQGEHRIPLGKFVPYKPSAEVPLLVAGPGVPANVTRREITSSIDLALTWAELGGVTLATDGLSLVPLLQGGNPPWRDSVLLEWGGSVAASLDDDLDGDILPATVPVIESAANRNRGQSAASEVEIEKRIYRAPPYYALRGATWLYIEWKGGFREYYDHAADDEDEINNIYGELSAARQEELAAKVQSMKICSGAQCN